MRTKILFALLLSLLNLASMAQKLTACLEQLNRKTDLTTTKFERVIKLSGNRTVYEFSITSKQQCFHCPRGTMYYDANCNLVASFTVARGPNGFVAYGYNESEFGKAGYQRINRGVEREPVPNAIAKVIADDEALAKANVKRVVQVKIKDKVLYGFQPQPNPKLPNCKDCPTAIVFYNGNYQPEVTFNVGGIAGVTTSEGYAPSDYANRKEQWILWSADEDIKMLNETNEQEVMDLPKNYVVGKNWLPDFGVFKPGDQLRISKKDGLKHYRKGVLQNIYKIIPTRVIEESSSASTVTKQHEIFYIGQFNRYFRIVGNNFMVTKAKYPEGKNITKWNNAEWTVAFNVK